MRPRTPPRLCYKLEREIFLFVYASYSQNTSVRGLGGSRNPPSGFGTFDAQKYEETFPVPKEFDSAFLLFPEKKVRIVSPHGASPVRTPIIDRKAAKNCRFFY